MSNRKKQEGFFLLSILLSTVLFNLFLAISWKTLTYYDQMISLQEKRKKFMLCADAFGLWVIALARQQFEFFLDFTNTPFVRLIDHWPLKDSLANGNFSIKSLGNDNLHIEATLMKGTQEKHLIYELARVDHNQKRIFRVRKVV